MRRYIKRGFSLVAVLVVLISLMPVGVIAKGIDFSETEQDQEKSNLSGNVFSGIYSYSEIEAGVCITGCGVIDGEHDVNLIIPSTLDGKKVIEIGDRAFGAHSELSSVSIPDGVTRIGDSAFSSSSIKSITIPSSVTSIGSEAFLGCEQLVNIRIPDSVTTIGEAAFSQCINLSNIILPNGLKSIGSAVFFGCKGLASITVPESVTSIEDDSFSNCSGLTNITIPDSVTFIGQRAFSECTSLNTVVLPKNIKTLQIEVFKSCSELENITIPDSVTSIESFAFWRCFKLTLRVPGGVSSIGERPFGQGSCGGIKGLIGFKGSCIETYANENRIPFTGLDVINVTGMKISEKTKTISYASSFELKAKISPENASINSIVWRSSAEYVASVDGSGKVTGHSNGTAIISATTIDGNITDTCCVTVTNPSTPNISLFITDKPSGQIINTAISLTAVGEGGNPPYKYRFCYELDNGYWETIQDYSIKNTAVFTPLKKGDYKLSVVVMDGLGVSTTRSIDHYVITDPNTEPETDPKPLCSYRTHVQNAGWQSWIKDGGMSGTSGKALRLEGIEIKIDGNADLGLEYSTHVENIGWQDFVKDGAMSGTSGKSLRLEAIKINLTGVDADKFDIYYQVHAQNFGWLDWAKNGDSAGTAGFGYRLEGIRIKVVPKREAAPGDAAKPFIEN